MDTQIPEYPELAGPLDEAGYQDPYRQLCLVPFLVSCRKLS